MRAIDADALLEYLNLMYDKQNDSNEPFNCAVLGAINYIKHKAPTIDAVSVVQGEWIDAEIPLECGGSMPIQVCNLCKTFYPLAYTGGGHRFCPNCGAKMKGADDE